MQVNDPLYDVVVVGAGNAALCAALSAKEEGARVLIIEKAPASEQGGNCPYTGAGFRFVHNGIEDLRGLLPDITDTELDRLTMESYTKEDFRDHLMSVTYGDTDDGLADVLISESRPTVEWMQSKGVTWELPIRGSTIATAPSVIPNSVGLSALRSGPGLIEMLTTAVRRNGITILYETKMMRIVQGPTGRISGIVVQDVDGLHEIPCSSVVLACGGFEANPEMRVKYLGTGWERAKVRGAKYNTGDGHRVALELGAKPFGQWTGCHATPIDINAPTTGILEVTDRMPRRSYPVGIMVNVQGRRFLDEGESFAEQTFVKVGTKILQQERSMAVQIFDDKATAVLEDRYGVSEAIKANTIRELSEKLEINYMNLKTTIEVFNQNSHDGEYKPRVLDGLSTKNIDPPKSNWAIKLDRPPFTAYRVTGGITYTYGGLQIDKNAQVLNLEDKPISGLFAAGEIVGGIFYHNSLRAAGLMHGSVFGKIAGKTAANSI